MLAPQKIDIREGSPTDLSRVYFFPEGEDFLFVADTAEHLLQNIKDLPPHEYYRDQLMPEVLAAMGLPADSEFHWDPLAGCSCGCSPGYVMDHSKGKDVFVTYDGTVD